MPSSRKFYRTVYTLEVLSEEPINGSPNLSDLHYLTTDGPCSGHLVEVSAEEVSGPEMARALESQASSPSYFQLTSDGEDDDDDENEDDDVEV